MSEADKTRLQAFVAAEVLKPQLADDGTAEPSLERAAAIMQTRAADYWTPNADFFGRMTKDHMLAVAAQVVDEGFASRHSKDKKGDLAVSLDAVFNPRPDANDAYWSRFRPVGPSSAGTSAEEPARPLWTCPSNDSSRCATIDAPRVARRSD